MKTSVLYVGLHVMQMMHGSVVEALLQLMARGLRSELFETLERGAEKDSDLILLHKTFDLEERLAVRVTSQLEREYCCFFHFVAGKRRVMEKANKINVS